VIRLRTPQHCLLEVWAERTGPTPTITRPDLDEVRDVKPKALRPYKVVVMESTTMCSMLQGAMGRHMPLFRGSIG
jgi:hypothetical protein